MTKRKLLVSFLLLIVCMTAGNAFSQLINGKLISGVYYSGSGSGGGGGGGGSGDLLTEQFEGANAGFDLTSWAQSGDVNGDPDYTTSPAPLNGSQSFHIVLTAQTSKAEHAVTSSTEVWVRFKFNVVSKTGSARIIGLVDNADNIQAFTEFDTSDTVPKFNLYDSATARNAVASDTFSVGTTYYAWLHYKIASGGGNNGILDLEFATTTTRLGSGTKYNQITNGNGTANIAEIRLGTGNPETYNVVIDDVLVSAVGYP